MDGMQGLIITLAWSRQVPVRRALWRLMWSRLPMRRRQRRSRRQSCCGHRFIVALLIHLNRPRRALAGHERSYFQQIFWRQIMSKFLKIAKLAVVGLGLSASAAFAAAPGAVAAACCAIGACCGMGCC
jgi:hypothetical protein